MSDKAASAPARTFLERLAGGTVVFDGAMGTVLYARGIFLNRCFDELNLSSPGLVRQVHDEYVEAGADVIETNTFGAHRFKLGPHGLEAQVRKINREGARIAREAAKGRALVAGAIGPIGKPLAPIGHIRVEEAQEAYLEQAEGLLEGGVDLFLLETMPSLDQAKAALAAVRSLTTDVPVAVSLTFNEEGSTIYGDTPEEAVRELEALGVPMIGANCSQGPQAMLETLQRMAAVARTAKLSAMPNAGSAALVEGRYVYLCTPEYMATWARRFLEAGATVVGGCCGTTPAHIKDLVRSVRMFQPARAEVKVAPSAPGRRRPPPRSPREAKSPLGRSLRRKFVVSVELDPPRGADPGAIIERAQFCKENEIDAINVADGPAGLGAHERAGAVHAAAGEGGDRHHPALHLPRPEPPRHPVGSARRPRAGPAQHPRHHRRPAQARRLPGRDRRLRRGLDRPHPDHGPPQPRLRPGGQPDRARPRHPRRLRRGPEQAGRGEGGPPARGEGEGRGRVRDDPARLRPEDRSSASSR